MAAGQSRMTATYFSKVAIVWLLILFQFQLAQGTHLRDADGSAASAAVDLDTVDAANKFPSMWETLEMARLSKLVYTFRHEDDGYCKRFKSSVGVKCHWYFHDKSMGTKVMLVSNSKQRYVAVVFAGTDDLRTSLEDVDIAQKRFGNNSTAAFRNHPHVKVHAGFDNAVFQNGLYDEIAARVKKLLKLHPFYRLWTTGHSLGAANSVLVATALAHNNFGHHVTSINFGCPQIGNKDWKEYFNNTSPLKDKLGIWRVVLGWDLVPRLPELFCHVGHTIQLWNDDRKKHDKDDASPAAINLVEAFYQHYGDSELQYVGVPSGWSSKPYIWVPGAMASHFISKYVDHLEHLVEENTWIDAFQKEALEPIGYDDDIYDEPPDDYYYADADHYFDQKVQ